MNTDSKFSGTVSPRVKLMFEHCEKSGVKISPYWRGYVESAMTELDVVTENIYSKDLLYTQSFIVGYFGFARPDDISIIERVLKVIALIAFKPFSLRIPWGVRNSPVYKVVFGPLFGLSSYILKYLEIQLAGRRCHQKVVKLVRDLIKQDISKYGLKPRKCKTPDDVDVLDPTTGERQHFSLHTLQAFSSIVFFQKLFDMKDKIMVEVGPGAGEMARLYLSLGLARRYILVDIPPALAFSEQYMIDEFGAGAVDRFDPNRTGIDYSDGKIVTALTPDQLHLIPSADAGINRMSFGEMSPSIVEKYVTELKKAGIKDFITVNHRTGKTNNKDVVSMREYIKFFAPEMSLNVAKTATLEDIIPQYIDDVPNEVGYQLLHFSRKE